MSHRLRVLSAFIVPLDTLYTLLERKVSNAFFRPNILTIQTFIDIFCVWKGVKC